MIVRDCTVDDGDTTSDTEIGRESHCWMVNMVNFDGVNMEGCALACNTDGCNRAAGVTRGSRHAVAAAVVGFLLATALTSSTVDRVPT